MVFPSFSVNFTKAEGVQVLITGKKYACETCIKGHRSSACKHTDRPLFEIKKKGRPVTQCEHCRTLRKTSQIHVKCTCEGKQPIEVSALKRQKGTPALPAHAAFPHGVPEALAAEGLPTNSSNEGFASGSPDLNDKNSVTSAPNTNTPIPCPQLISQYPPTSHHVFARVAELRRVCPRPSLTEQHHLVHGHCFPYGHREHFSPYARALDCAVGSLSQHDTSDPSVGSFRSSASHRSESQRSLSASPSCDGVGEQTLLHQPSELSLLPSLARATFDAGEEGGFALLTTGDATINSLSANYSNDGFAVLETRCCEGGYLNSATLSLLDSSAIDGLGGGVFDGISADVNGVGAYEPLDVPLEVGPGSKVTEESGFGLLDKQAIDEWVRGVGLLPSASELHNSVRPPVFGDGDGFEGNSLFGERGATAGEQVYASDVDFSPDM